MKDGFYTALGTPSDEFGHLHVPSFRKQIMDQMDAGASGLLVMGSMGIGPCIKQDEYFKTANVAAETAKGACPVMVGVMDNSAGRVLDRIECLKMLKIDGVVATTPFYFNASQDELVCFFEHIAAKSAFPLFLYDLPVVTKIKMAVPTIERLMGHQNIKGIKTGDLISAKALLRSQAKRDDFNILFSTLDLFDAASLYGLKKNLDGMFSCTAALACQMYKHLDSGEYENASIYLDRILLLRDTFMSVGALQGFTYAMNILGYEGNYTPDYAEKFNNCDKDIVIACMKQIHLI